MSSLRHTILRLLEPLRNRVAGMVARAVVTLVDDKKRMQELQLQLLGETIAGAERVQNYGLTSKPFPPTGEQAAEAVVLFVGGGRDHPLVVAVDDRRHRPTDLADGEVALYDDRGVRVHIQRAQLLITDPTRLRLEVGNSSIQIDSEKITITTPELSIIEG